MYNVRLLGIHCTPFRRTEGITSGRGVREMRRVGMVRVGLYLSDLQMKKLKTTSKKKGLTVSEIIRRMIDEGFERSKEGK